MKITNHMINKWAKAGLLVFFGIILAIYIDGVNSEMQRALSHLIQGEATFVFQLLTAIEWIIILWCFVDAALNILTSFREPKLSLDDLGAKLDSIEKKISAQSPQPPQPPYISAQKPIVVEQEEVGVEESEEIPAPAPPNPPVPPPP